MAEENGKTAEKLALTREEFRYFDGRVTVTLEGIQKGVSNIEKRLDKMNERTDDHEKRLGKLENKNKLGEKVRNNWHDWLIVGLPGWLLAAVTLAVLYARK